MPQPPQEHDVTRLLQEWTRTGDREAIDRLLPLVEKELHRIARSLFHQERSSHTLQPTALVNEAYVRLLNHQRLSLENRVHFFSFAARIMRRILVDYARQRNAEKRGAGVVVEAPAEEAAIDLPRDVDLLALDEALNRLAALDERQARFVELRYFAGLALQEIADLEEVSRSTVDRDLAMARAWLKRELRTSPSPGSPSGSSPGSASG